MRKNVKFFFHFLMDFNFFKRLFSLILLLKLILFNFKKINFSKKNILVLNNTRFNFDLNDLNIFKKYNLILIPINWQYRVIAKWIYKVPQITFFENKKKNILVRKKLRKYIQQILHYPQKFFDFKSVLGTSVHYKSDLDLGEYFSSIGVPYIIFHKEGFFVTKTQQKFVKNIYSKFKQLEADLIFTNNEITKKILVKTCCKKIKIKSYGNMIYNKIPKPKKNSKKTITFFSFHYRAGLFKKKVFEMFGKKGWINLFNESHKTFIETAISDPKNNYIIKLKWGGEWEDKIMGIKKEITKNDIPNLKIVSQANSFDLINKSNRIVAFNSSAILESLILRKDVICLDFEETSKKKYFSQVIHNQFKKYIHVAKSKKKLEELLLKKKLKLKSSFNSQIRYDTKNYLSTFTGKIVSKKTNRELKKFL